MENMSTSGIFNSSLLQKINRECKPCIFKTRLKRNLTKYLFDFFYYRELYSICSTNLFFYQCFTEYQLMTWKLEMNNIIDIFHLKIKNYDEEIDDTLTKTIQRKRTYSMSDHSGCFIKINSEGINLISIAYYDDSIQRNINHKKPLLINKKKTDLHPSPLKLTINTYNNDEINLNSINENLSETDKNVNNINNTIESISEPMSNLGSTESIINNNKINETTTLWDIKDLEDSYTNNPCVYLIKTAPLNFGFSFHHVIKGDYQLYLHHSLVNMKNARLVLQVYINNVNVYTNEEFPSQEIIEQDNREQKEKEKNIKLKDDYICDISKKMFDEANFNINNIEEDLLEEEEDKNKFKDYEVRVTFKNQDLFWKAGWCLDGGRLLRKKYEVSDNDSNNKYFKRFKSEDINIFGSIKIEQVIDDNSSNSITILKSKMSKRNSVDALNNNKV